jgi:multidrug efflux pump subunit AcrA (membrane-fusion protein)
MPRGFGWGSPSSDLVESELVAQVHYAGGALSGSQVGRVYKRVRGAKDVVQAAGGLRRFCDQSNRLRFIPEPGPESGPGQIRLRCPTVTAHAVDPARERELEHRLAAAEADAVQAKADAAQARQEHAVAEVAIAMFAQEKAQEKAKLAEAQRKATEVRPE